MIGKLSGVIDSVSGSQAIIDVQGVGYVVACSARTLRQLGAPGTGAALKIETIVREDAISLYGFIDQAEQDWFRLLTTVQGVGAKVALALLGALTPDRLAEAIIAQDKASITEADGVGPKLALRIITELKDKLPALSMKAVPLRDGEKSAAPTPAGDAVSALVNLGYRRAEAFAAVAAAARRLDAKAKLDDLIRASLAELSQDAVAVARSAEQSHHEKGAA